MPCSLHAMSLQDPLPGSFELECVITGTEVTLGVGASGSEPSSQRQMQRVFLLQCVSLTKSTLAR